MLERKDSLVGSKKVRSLANNVIKIDSGSYVIDNKFISVKDINYSVNEYVLSAVVSPRTSFFVNRNYAVMLVVGINSLGVVSTVEGSQVKYTTNDAVPLPHTINFLPLIGIVLRQDGTVNLNSFKDLKDTDLIEFSGYGNIEEKNQVGDRGPESFDQGATGVQGETGPQGLRGLQGYTGFAGHTGLDGVGVKGEAGLPGMTGINWLIHIPFENFY
jgi:hypothetical protein